MKRYISSAYKYTDSGKITYTSLQDLQKILEGYGYNRGYMGHRASEKDFEFPIQFVAGQANFVVKEGISYEIVFEGNVLSQGLLSWLFRSNTKDNLIYNKICVASPSRISKVGDPQKIEKALQAKRLKEIKQMSTDEMLEYINGIRNIDDEIAEDAMRQLRYKIPDDDLITLTNGHWRMEVIDSKAENWASLTMQAYGWHYTTTVQLETSTDTYTVDVKRTEGWHTE